MIRKNEFITLDQFQSQYTGEWAPSEGHWFGLDFSWHDCIYRLHTGMMYEDEPSTLADGRDVLFSLYKKTGRKTDSFVLVGQYASMDDLLESKVIENTPFSAIIVDPDTELLGQD